MVFKPIDINYLIQAKNKSELGAVEISDKERIDGAFT